MEQIKINIKITKMGFDIDLELTMSLVDEPVNANGKLVTVHNRALRIVGKFVVCSQRCVLFTVS